MTSAWSRVYDSRSSGDPGSGFPSCATELCRIPPNRRDPHGYYAEIGVSPSASPDQIRRAVRALYRRLHPDTGSHPDTLRMQRVKMIAEVLLDPESRHRYNSTPPGMRMLDKLYRSELASLPADALPAEVKDVNLAPAVLRSGYDYLAVDHRDGDRDLAQRWYAELLRTAPLAGYRRRVKVLLHDGPSWFHSETSVLAIPRFWRPSPGLAFGLWVVVAEQRHPAWCG